MLSEKEIIRRTEIDKYTRAYKSPHYGMGKMRMTYAKQIVDTFEAPGSYLDVGCGRGEMMEYAMSRGLCVTGVDPALVLSRPLKIQTRIVTDKATDLRFFDNEFDYSTMFDVLEHLLPLDDIAALYELRRVTAKTVVVTANNDHSTSIFGDELHINRRPYTDWDRLIRKVFVGDKVTWLPRGMNISETWRIDLCAQR